MQTLLTVEQCKLADVNSHFVAAKLSLCETGARPTVLLHAENPAAEEVLLCLNAKAMLEQQGLQARFFVCHNQCRISAR